MNSIFPFNQGPPLKRWPVVTENEANWCIEIYYQLRPLLMALKDGQFLDLVHLFCMCRGGWEIKAKLISSFGIYWGLVRVKLISLNSFKSLSFTVFHLNEFDVMEMTFSR